MKTMTTDPILLDEELTDFKSKKRIQAKLFKDRLELYTISKSSTHTQIVYTKDISGVALSKLKENHPCVLQAYLSVYTYVKLKSGKRKREELVLEFSGDSKAYEENLVCAQRWDRELRGVLDVDVGRVRPILIFVNPKAGAGKARNIFYERVLTVLSEANVAHVLVLTEYANFAREYIRTLNLSDYSGIIAISGDGLLHEIINGLSDRPDRSSAIKMPIGQIPGGSANALACSISYINDQPFRNLSLEEFATHMTFNLVKSKPIPLDIISIQLSDKTIINSFLSIQWAIIADVDLESEKFRYLGEARFTIGAIKRILDLRIYRGRISFLPADSSTFKFKDTSIKVIQNTYETQANNIPNAKFPFKYLRPFNEPVANDWQIIDEKFVLFLIMNLPILTSDFSATPDAKTCDGCMHMIFIREGISKFELVKLFTDTVSGMHMQSEFIEYVRIKAFRIEPLCLLPGQAVTGNFMIDGERIPYGSIQGEIMPSIANVYAMD